ncbi:hypothetical protein Hanom_Chr13g01219631 [Helianthus anomalus]
MFLDMKQTTDLGFLRRNTTTPHNFWICWPARERGDGDRFGFSGYCGVDGGHMWRW